MIPGFTARGGGFCVWVLPADADLIPMFRDLHRFACFWPEVLWTISWYSYSGTCILDAEELHEKAAVLFLYLETCGVRK